MQKLTPNSLIEDVRIRLTHPTNWEPFNLQDVQRWTIQSHEDLAARIRSSEFGDQFFGQGIVLTLSGSTNSLSLVDDFVPSADRIDVASWVVSTSELRPLVRVNAREASRIPIEEKDWNTWKPRYKIQGDQIVFYPTPVSTVQLQFDYSTGFNLNMNNLDEEVVYYSGWYEYLINDVAAKLFSATSKDENPYISAREASWELICKLNAPRDDWGAIQVKDNRYDDPWLGGLINGVYPYDGFR